VHATLKYSVACSSPLVIVKFSKLETAVTTAAVGGGGTVECVACNHHNQLTGFWVLVPCVLEPKSAEVQFEMTLRGWSSGDDDCGTVNDCALSIDLQATFNDCIYVHVQRLLS
jgi:hypothetical protein